MNTSDKINNKSAIIGIIGLGYVGLPIALRFSEVGFPVIGFDLDKKKVNSLNEGTSYLKSIANKEISNARKNKFRITSNFDLINELDVIIVCVPTPLNDDLSPNLSYIKNTLTSIKPYLKSGQVLILESTTYPGNTRELVAPFIKSCGFKIGVDFYIGYSPERIDPGNLEYTFKNIPKIVSGYTSNCLNIVKSLYSQVVDDTVTVSSTDVAEMTKMLENIQRSVNIALVNELKLVADKMGIDIFETINASATKPFGFMPYYPGPGLGGHCIPIDPYYLTWKADKLGVETKLIELAGKINTDIPNFIISKVKSALNNNNKSIKGSKVLILGLAYKKNSDDTRESPSLVLIDLLLKLEVQVEYSDPYIPFSSRTRKYDFKLNSLSLTSDIISSFDLVLLTTDHDSFDYKFIYKHSNLIIDTRGRFEISKKVVRA